MNTNNFPLLRRISFRIKDFVRFRAGNKIRKANNYLTLSEIYYLAKKLNLTILDPYSVLIGKSVTLSTGNTIYPNVTIKGNVIIGSNCEIGFGGGAVIAAPKGKIKVGSNVRITNGAQILDNVILEDGSQVLGPVTLSNIILKGGGSYKDPNPDTRGAVAKGGIRIKTESGIVRQGEVVDAFRHGTEIERQASKHQPPNLEETYREKIIQGRIWPFTQQEGYLRNALEFDPSGEVIFEKGRPSYNRIENLYFYLGMPLPSKEITQRIVAFRQALAKAGHFSPHDFYPNLSEELHVTLFYYRWDKDSKEPSPHPIVKDPEKLQKFIESVRDILIKPITIYFKEFALFDNGAVVACGYPQDFPQGHPGPSSVDLIRESYLKQYPKVMEKPLDITHITVGRFLRQITEEEHGIVLKEIDEFNREPLGSIIFDKINVFHEKMYWLSEGEDLATISIDLKDPKKKKIFMLKAISIDFKEVQLDPRIQEVSIKGEREASGYAVWIKDPSKIQLFYHEEMLSYDFSKHFIIDPKRATSEKNKKKVEELLKKGLTFQPAQGKRLEEIVAEGRENIVFACNGETDNMWASNSVIVVEGKIIKRKDAPGVNAEKFYPLNGRFSFFVFDPGRVRIEDLTFKQGELKRPLTFKNGIRGPVLIRKDQDQDQTHRLLQVKPNTPNTEQNDVLWDPKVNQAAMTAVGSNARGEIVFVSLKGDPDKGNEILLSDMVKVLRELGAVNAVLLGLSGDVQQYLPLPGRESPFLIAKPRTGSTMEKMFPEGRPLSSAIIVER